MHQTVAPQLDAHSPDEDFTSWKEALVGETGYCLTVIHHIDPDEALRRLGARPEHVASGTWQDLLERAESEGADDLGDLVVAAFALGPHTLLVESDRCEAIDCRHLSKGTFAASCYVKFNADFAFVVFRDGVRVAHHNQDSCSAEPTTPEVRQALAAMGYEDVIEAAAERAVELLCRTMGIRPAAADVIGAARIAVVTE